MRGNSGCMFWAARVLLSMLDISNPPKTMFLQNRAICYKWCPCMGRRLIFLVCVNIYMYIVIFIFIYLWSRGRRKWYSFAHVLGRESQLTKALYIGGRGKLSRGVHVYQDPWDTENATVSYAGLGRESTFTNTMGRKRRGCILGTRKMRQFRILDWAANRLSRKP